MIQNFITACFMRMHDLGMTWLLKKVDDQKFIDLRDVKEWFHQRWSAEYFVVRWHHGEEISQSVSYKYGSDEKTVNAIRDVIDTDNERGQIDRAYASGR